MTSGCANDARDRRDVADEIEIELVVERRVDRVRRSDKEERVAVRRRPHDRLGADIGAGARPVLDDEWLAEPLRQPLADQARDDVGPAARREWRRSSAPAASDRLAPRRSAGQPGARQRPLPDAEIDGGEVSWRPIYMLKSEYKCDAQGDIACWPPHQRSQRTSVRSRFQPYQSTRLSRYDAVF